jgi:AraC-like DNA-binding protein
MSDSNDLAATLVRPVPHEIFQGEMLPAHERFAVWREAVLPLFDCLPSEGVDTECFSVQLEGYDLHRTFVSLSCFSPLHFWRARNHAAGEGCDHLLVQLYLEGGYIGENGSARVRVEPGDISLLDLGMPLATQAYASQALSVVIPRDLMSQACGGQNWIAGTVLRAGSPVTNILAHHMLAIWHSLQNATLGELESINRILIGSIAGAFATQAPTLPGRVTLEAICAYIQDNLESRNLTPEHLCRRFGCSRSQLYRMFLPEGGVAAYIRRARLERCRDELMSGRYDLGRIFDVAVQWGFDSQSHFCRLFRREFGVTPGEVMELGKQRKALRQLPVVRDARQRTPAFHFWLRQLSLRRSTQSLVGLAGFEPATKGL